MGQKFYYNFDIGTPRTVADDYGQRAMALPDFGDASARNF